jgi:putative copper export protein
MDPLFWFNVFIRWLHVTSAVSAIGAMIFMRVVLQPAVTALDPSTRQVMAEQVLPRFKTLLHSALGLLLLTGAYNLWIAIPKVRALAYHTLYHSVIGTKILLFLVLFGFVSAALSSSPASVNMQESRQRWLTVLIILALVILFLSAILRRLWDLH